MVAGLPGPPDWPHARHGRLLEVGGQRWHVQQWPRARAPRVLLLHGTGASTHSFRTLAPLLAAGPDGAEVLVPDLPGHGHSGPAPGGDWSLPGLARQLAALLKARRFAPDLAVGHSAGAAILAQALLHEGLHAGALVALNGAFLPFGGVAAPLLSPLARLLYVVPGVPGLFSSRAADPAVVRRLVEGTGSRLDDEGLALYGRLMQTPSHTRAALAMMAHWDLVPLLRALPGLPCPLHLVVGGNDRAVAPSQAGRVAALVPGATLERLTGLGHLAHEEAPERVAALLRAWLPAVPRAEAPA
jgi:magnesium chelatase accessory protein